MLTTCLILLSCLIPGARDALPADPALDLSTVDLTWNVDPQQPLVAILGDEDDEDDDEEEDEDDDDLTEEEKREQEKIDLRRRIITKLPELYNATATLTDDTINLVYRKALDFENDTKPLGKNKVGNTLFDPVSLRLPSGYPLCFAGSTYGGFYLTKPFTGKIHVKVVVQFQLIEKTAFFQVLLLTDAKEMVGTSYGVDLFAKKRKKSKPKMYRCPDRAYRKPASEWISRTSLTAIDLLYDPAKKTLRCAYGAAGGITNVPMMEMGASNWFQTKELKDPINVNKIGFLWKGCKFRVHEIKIEAGMDYDWAKKLAGE